MAIQTEGFHDAEFLLSEGNNTISREQVNITAGDAIEPGTAIAFDEQTGQYSAASSYMASNIAGILYGAVEASTAQRSGVIIARLAEVSADCLVGYNGTSEEKGNLAALNIIVR
jgi:hypothetical protein